MPKNPLSHSEVPNLSGRCDPIVEQAIRNLYLRFYKFGGTTIINQAPEAGKTKPRLPVPTGPATNGGSAGANFQVRVEGYGALTIEGLSGNGTAEFFAPSVDETDAEWYAKGSAIGTDDPVDIDMTLVGESRWGIQVEITKPGSGYTSAPSVSITGLNGTGSGASAIATINPSGQIDSITVSPSGYGYQAPLTVTLTGGGGTGATAVASLGRQWAVGDYILANDPTIVNRHCSYEIFQITKISGTTFTLSRGQLGSVIVPHAADIKYYRLIPRVFTQTMTGETQTVPLYWPTMTVPALVGFLPGKSPTTLNFTPEIYVPGSNPARLDPRTNPPTPGLRTMEGAAYINLTKSGALSRGSVADFRVVGVQSWQSIRGVYARVKTAPVGAVQFGQDPSAAIVIYVCYISAAGTVGLIDTLVIDSGQTDSYSSSNPPDGRQMPYHLFWPTKNKNFDWPPNRLPSVKFPLAGGVLVRPLAVGDIDPDTTVFMAPDGQIDFIVGQIGSSTAGSDLNVAIQT